MGKRSRPRTTHNILRDEDAPTPSADGVLPTQLPSTSMPAPDPTHMQLSTLMPAPNPTPIQPSTSTRSSELLAQVTKESTNRGPYKGIKLDKRTEGGKKKLMISIPPERHMAPVGENAQALRSHLGGIVKQVTIAPIWEWSKVMEMHGMVLMHKAMDYFEVNLKGPEKWVLLKEGGNAKPDTPEEKKEKYHRFCVKSMQDDYRRGKSSLHCHYKAFETDKERRQNVPKCMPSSLWDKMCEIFGSPMFQCQSEINAANRAMQMDPNMGAPPRISRSTYETLVQIEDRALEEGQNPLARDDILVKALGSRSGYVRGMESGYKPLKTYQGSTSKSALTQEVAKLRTTITTQEGKIVAQKSKISAQEGKIDAYEERFATQDRRMAEQERMMALMA